MSDLDFQELGIAAAAVTATAFAAYHFTRAQPTKYPYDFKNQSRLLDGPERVRVAQFLKDGDHAPLTLDGASTLYEGFLQGCKASGDHNCLGTRADDKSPFTWISYNQAKTRAQNIGSGFAKLGLKPTECVGLYAQNRAEWVLTEQACNAFSLVTVPLYDTLGPDVVEFISSQTSLKLIACEPNKVKPLLVTAKVVNTIKYIVKFGAVTQEEKDAAAPLGVTVYSLDEVDKIGQENPAAPVPPKPSDLATICYTSGTTGLPKGAMLTHGNIISDVAGAAVVLDLIAKINYEDVHISYLPLAHVFERVVQALMWVRGAQVGFFRGDVLGLVSDIQELRPTIFPSVPRLLNRIHDKVIAGVEAAGGIKKILFNFAFESKKAELARGVVRSDSLWDKIVFKKIQQTLGGRVRFVITGAAPISKDVLTFFRVVLGCNVLEGYGQTESSAGSTMTLPGDTEPGHVGPPLPNNAVKLADVPEMGYFAKDDRGEICFKGPSVFVGYWKNEEKTKEALDEDGWLHSGDIGEWTPKGTIRIIDRKKNIFKLAQGEYIAPEKIENIYVLHPALAQAFVYGDSLEAATVGLLFAEPATFELWAEQNGFKDTFASLIKNPAVVKQLLTEITKLGSSKGLKSFEQVKAIYIHSEVMSVENNLLTPTFKAKRNDIEKLFKPTIKALYASLASAASSSSA